MSEQSAGAVERFQGPDYLTGFTPDREAVSRLRELDSHTAQRLVKFVRDGWPGILSGEDFLGPLAQAEGDVLLRVLSPPGSEWIWWRGAPCETHFYGRVHALPHHHGHEVTGRYSGSADRLAEFLVDGKRVIPVHVKNVPEPIWECVKNDSPYERQ